MKQVLLAVIIVACFSSAVLAGLTRVYVIVNMDDAPIEILKFGESRGEGGSIPTEEIECKNKTDRDIEALAIIMIYYDAFDEKEGGLRRISIDLLKATQADRLLWGTYGSRFVKTAMAFVSAVRFIDGEVWKADTKKVIETAGDMPELSFLSETEMLEIEKE